ncbi:MAG: alpha-amylase family glycosyl hydrolase [Gammaproteobacteria bacterium]
MSHIDRAAAIAQAMMHRPPRPDPPEWWRGAMFYEVYLRSFRDSNADGLGDIPGVIEKLDYICDLGVDGMWLSPFYPSPQIDFGYDIVDFCRVDPVFGTMDDFRELLSAAHECGLKVLIDFVPCHTSDQHPWFLESKQDRDNHKADWYVWAEQAPDGGPPNNWLSSFGGSAWQWEPRRAQYYYHPFLTCQPALNLQNPAALQAILDVLRFWMDQGVDGFRLDAIQCLCCDANLRDNPPSAPGESHIMVGGGPNNPFRRQQHIFDRDVPEAMPVLEALRDAVREYEPERILIGELADVDSSRLSAKYTLQDERLHSVYDFDLINAAASLEDWRDILRVRNEYMASGWMMNVFTNHDSVRAVSNLTHFAADHGKTDQAAKLLLFLQSTLLGGGIIFQGEELGLTQPQLRYEDLQDPWGKTFWPDFAGRDGVRTPMPWKHGCKNAGFSEADDSWLPVAEEHVALAVDCQEKRSDSVLSFFRTLMDWRKTEPLVRTGKEIILELDAAQLIAYDRFDDRRRLTFIANISMDERWYSLDDGDRLVELQGCIGERNRNGVSLSPLGIAIVERRATSPRSARE